MRDFHPRCFAVSSHDGMPYRQQPWGKEVMLDERHEAFAAYTMPQQLTLVKRSGENQVTNVNLCSRNVA